MRLRQLKSKLPKKIPGRLVGAIDYNRTRRRCEGVIAHRRTDHIIPIREARDDVVTKSIADTGSSTSRYRNTSHRPHGFADISADTIAVPHAPVEIVAEGIGIWNGVSHQHR